MAEIVHRFRFLLPLDSFPARQPNADELIDWLGEACRELQRDRAALRR